MTEVSQRVRWPEYQKVKELNSQRV